LQWEATSRRQQCVVSHSAPYIVIALRLSGIGPLHQRVTMGTLPDDILLKIFKTSIDGIESYFKFRFSPSEEWHALVHVCRRWRNLVFTSPRHLNLVLLCWSPNRSAKEMLDIWPELPISVHHFHPSRQAADDVVAVLKLNHRVSGIRLAHPTNTAWETFAPLMQHSFPALTHLWVESYSPKQISRSFLGGSAPSLRDLVMIAVPFPALPELLLSATNLVRLWLDQISPSGYISPQAMVTSLSTLTRLESLSVTFLVPRDRPESVPDRAVRIPPPHPRILLPSLTYLRLQGSSDYVEDFLAQIDTPLLESVQITLFSLDVLEVSELAKFVRRADKLLLAHQAKVTFMSDSISIRLSPKSALRPLPPKTLELDLICPQSTLRRSYLAQCCASCLPTLSPFESLRIVVSVYDPRQDPIFNPDPQWLELLRLFDTVKKLYLSTYVAPRVAQILRRFSAEQVMEVLPTLENVFISSDELLGPVKEVLSEFADARQLAGHPLCIDGWEGAAY